MVEEDIFVYHCIVHASERAQLSDNDPYPYNRYPMSTWEVAKRLREFFPKPPALALTERFAPDKLPLVERKE